MFSLHIENGVIQIRSGSVEWTKAGNRWFYTRGTLDDLDDRYVDKKTEDQLDEQLKKFRELIS